MIFVTIVAAMAYVVFGVHFDPNALLIAFALGLISDSVRSNRVAQSKAAQAALTAYARSLVERKPK